MRDRSSIAIALGIPAYLAGLVLECTSVIAAGFPDILSLARPDLFAAHSSASILVAGGAALLLPRVARKRERLVPFILFALLALLIPALGVFLVTALAAVLAKHARKPRLDRLPVRVTSSQSLRLALDSRPSGNTTSPLVFGINDMTSEQTRSAALGMDGMSLRATRPLLQKLQSSPDLRTQLYANGRLNEQREQIERQLHDLQQRIDDRPDDIDSYAAITDLHLLLDHELIPADEREAFAGRAAETARIALESVPRHPVLLAAITRFHLLLGEFGNAARAIVRLRRLPFARPTADRLWAELRFEYASSHPHRPSLSSGFSVPFPRD